MSVYESFVIDQVTKDFLLIQNGLSID